MSQDNFPVYLINLKHAHKRRENSIKQLHKLEIDPIVIAACNGHKKDFPFHQYRHLSRGKWWDKNIFKPGAFACYLSHAKCWEKIAVGSAPYALILEDDMIINQKEFQKFKIGNELNSFDIIFVNYGVTRLIELSSLKEDAYNNDFISLNKILIDLLVHNKFNDNLTPGSYGYFVSKQGAIRLLKMMEQEKICMGVDYAMIFNSFNNHDIETIKKLKDVPHYLQVYLDNMKDNTSSLNYERISLNSYIYTCSTPIAHNDSESSTLEHTVFNDFDVFNRKKSFLEKIKSIIQTLPTLSLFKDK